MSPSPHRTRETMSAFATTLRFSITGQPSIGPENAMRREPTYPILERLAATMVVLTVAGLLALFAAWYDPPLVAHASARPTLDRD